jgi:signal peptidase
MVTATMRRVLRAPARGADTVLRGAGPNPAPEGTPAETTPARSATSARYPLMSVWQKWRRRRWWWWIGRNWLRTGALAFIGGYGLLTVWSIVPILFGWTPVVIVSGSMTPGIRPGDVVVFEPVAVPEQLGVGRVVLVDDPDRPGKFISHRVFEHRADHSLILKGDANPTPDPAPVRQGAVHGAARLIVPYVGRVTLWNERNRPLAATWTAVTVLAIGLCRNPERRRRKGPAPNGAERRIELATDE